MQEYIRQVPCFTKEEQAEYESLNYKQRNYVDLRGAGVPKSEAYRRAGYTTQKNCSTNAIQLENRSPVRELIQKIARSRVANELYKDGTEEEKMQQLDSLSQGKFVDDLLMDTKGELAKQLTFYQNIADGRIRSKKVTKTKDKEGRVISEKEEIIDDVSTRMKARQKVDEILGLNAQREVGRVKAGPITVKIVDASKKKEPEPLNIDITKEENQEVVEAEILQTALVDEKDEDNGE